jgi:hypothetical protein
MQRKRGNGILLLIAVGLVLWFIVSKTRIVLWVPLSLTSFLLLIGLGVLGIYVVLRWIF